MSEIQHEIGREGVNLAHQYLGSTLKFDNFWTAYDRSGNTKAKRIDSESHKYDLKCAYIEKYNPLSRKTVYVEVKYRSISSDLGESYNDFVLKSFSVFLQEQKDKESKREFDAYYLFFVNHPFYCSKFDKIREVEYIKNLIEGNQDKYGIGGNYGLNQIIKFCNLVWVIIFCREPQELFFHHNRDEVIDFLSGVVK